MNTPTPKGILENSINGRDQTWCRPDVACSFNIPAHEVHVWRARLSSSTADLTQRRGSLSSEEQERADRFRSEHDRTQFVLGRIVARSVLGHCLQEPAGDVQLKLDDLGKPIVAARSETPIHFNISHSGDYVLFALARERRVGVDVEQIRKTEDLNEIAARYFSKIEYLRLLTVPERLRTESFYRCWTMKEAYLKARGDGFKLPMDSFDVAFLPGERPRLLETRFDHVDTRRWCFHELDLGSTYHAALATEVAPELELKLWVWNGWQING
jgi:4'-phosphopantetheinyl transferase